MSCHKSQPPSPLEQAARRLYRNQIRSLRKRNANVLLKPKPTFQETAIQPPPPKPQSKTVMGLTFTPTAPEKRKS